ncbi:MAG: hypothetical protein LZF60_50188 [Nitrospira sp.]|nr:hypothetical protein [Nitrospira sp.]ULA58454.1 MAG: hypothetical protein LZF60_50188 [Nitrospira sp.]
MLWLFPIDRFQKKILAVSLAVSLASCATVESLVCLPHGEDVPFDIQMNKLEACIKSDKKDMNDNDDFEAGSVKHPVYCFPGDRSKPPVLLLHELPGLSGKTLAYAKELSEDFTVYVPLLFGEPNMHSALWGSTAFWLNGEWWGLESGSSDILGWLRAVVSEIERVHPQHHIGVIGNCLTGSLPLALLSNPKTPSAPPRIHAVVLAQPTLPLTIFDNREKVRSSLGISQDEVKAAEQSSARIFYLRFEQDCISKPEKRWKVWDIFTKHSTVPDRVIPRQIPKDQHPVDEAHSTLIGEWSETESGRASRNARQDVRRFLLDPTTFKIAGEQ